MHDIPRYVQSLDKTIIDLTTQSMTNYLFHMVSDFKVQLTFKKLLHIEFSTAIAYPHLIHKS